FIPGKQGYDVTKFSSPPPPKKSNKKKAKLAAKLKDKIEKVQGAENPATEQETTSIKEFDLVNSKKKDKVQQYKEESIKEIHLAFCTDEYRAMKRENALKNYHKRESEKRRERRLNLLTLYYNSSDFVTLNNLDLKIADMYNDIRQPFTTTLEDMQIDYQEGGGIIDDLELKRRLDRIKDTLSGTAQGGKQKLGLDKIEEYAIKLQQDQEMSETNSVESLFTETNSVEFLSTETSNVEPLSTEKNSVEPLSSKKNSVEPLSSERNGAESFSKETISVEPYMQSKSLDS
ncbi:6232_t:CDS:2, partial [Funneliformis geosporum]